MFCLSVSQLDAFIDQAFTGNNELVFSSGTTLDSFRQLYSTPFESQQYRAGKALVSYFYENSTILPRRSIAGTYICEGRNNNGTRNTTITVDVNGNIILQYLILAVTLLTKDIHLIFMCINARSFNTTLYRRVWHH